MMKTPESCGFCNHGQYGQPPDTITCPYCEGSGRQLTPAERQQRWEPIDGSYPPDSDDDERPGIVYRVPLAKTVQELSATYNKALNQSMIDVAKAVQDTMRALGAK